MHHACSGQDLCAAAGKGYHVPNSNQIETHNFS
jgi:hypothetical protein